jgi:hypothetical protein
LLVLLLLGGGWVLAAASVYVLRIDGPIPWLGGIALVTKPQLDFQETFHNVRDWTVVETIQHHQVVARLKQVDRMDLLPSVCTRFPSTAPAQPAVSAAARKQPLCEQCAAPCCPACGLCASHARLASAAATTRPAAPSAQAASPRRPIPAAPTGGPNIFGN